jgi:uncharacterized membrane protein
LHNPTKTQREINTLIGVFCKTPWAKSFPTYVIGRVLFMARRIELNCNTLVQYCKNVLVSIAYLFTLCGVLHNPTKTYPKDNLINACNLMFILCKLKFRE